MNRTASNEKRAWPPVGDHYKLSVHFVVRTSMKKTHTTTAISQDNLGTEAVTNRDQSTAGENIERLN
jgi:hypothetical protein